MCCHVEYLSKFTLLLLVFFSPPPRPKRYKTYAYLIAWNDKFNKEHKLSPKKTGHNADSLGNVLAYSRGEPKCGLVISHQTKKPKARCNGRYLFNQLLFCSFFFQPFQQFSMLSLNFCKVEILDLTD